MMAGLLDAFNSDEGLLGLGLLMAAAPSPQNIGIGARLGTALNWVQGQKESRDDRKAAQMLNAARVQEIQSKLDRENKLLGLIGMSQGGQVDPTQQPTAQGQQQGGSVYSRIPREVLAAEILSNGGKNLGEWGFKTGMPDMQVSNGYAYDKNRLGPGYLPQLNTSTDGRTSMIQIGPDGLPVVSAPRGAVETYGGYQNMGERVKNSNTLAPLDRIDPQTNRPYPATVDQLVGKVSGYAGGSRDAANADALRVIQGELVQARAKGDTQTVQALEREIARIGSQSGFNGFAGPADTAKAVKQAEADVTRSEGNITKGTKANELLSGAQRARELLGKNPTESLIGAGVDKAASWVGATPKGADAASQLEALSGWMVSNVPRMEGPQSNFDVQNYMTMAGKIGDRTIPVAQRLAALNEVEALQRKYADLNNIPISPKVGGGATGEWGQPKKRATLQDIAETARKSGRSTAEVTQRLKELGYEIGGN